MKLWTNENAGNIFAQENYQVMNYGPGGLISVHMDDTTLGYQQEDFDQAQSLVDWRMGTIRRRPAVRSKYPHTSGLNYKPP